jgi:hypothetical protein
MKKIGVLSLAALTLALAGCGSGNDASYEAEMKKVEQAGQNQQPIQTSTDGPNSGLPMPGGKRSGR